MLKEIMLILLIGYQWNKLYFFQNFSMKKERMPQVIHGVLQQEQWLDKYFPSDNNPSTHSLSLSLTHTHTLTRTHTHTQGRVFSLLILVCFLYSSTAGDGIWHMFKSIYGSICHWTKTQKQFSCIDKNEYIVGLFRRAFINGPGERSSIPSRVIPITKKWYSMPLCLTLSTIR